MGTWSPAAPIIATQFEKEPLSFVPITFVPDDPLEVVESYKTVPIDEFPEKTVFHDGSSGGASAEDLIGFFDGKIRLQVKFFDTTTKEYTRWEDLEADIDKIAAIYAYFPPPIPELTRMFEVTATVIDAAGGKREEKSQFGVTIRFDHDLGRDKLIALGKQVNDAAKARYLSLIHI